MLHDTVPEDVNIFSTTNRYHTQHWELIYTRVRVTLCMYTTFVWAGFIIQHTNSTIYQANE